MKLDHLKIIRHLNRHELWFLIRAAGLLMVLPVLQRVLSLHNLLKLLQPGGAGKPACRGTSKLDMNRIVSLTDGLLWRKFWVFKPVCLRRSFVLFRYLRQAGYPVSVCFGIENPDTGFSGHSWLEMDGTVIAERDENYRRFKVTYRFP